MLPRNPRGLLNSLRKRKDVKKNFKKKLVRVLICFIFYLSYKNNTSFSLCVFLVCILMFIYALLEAVIVKCLLKRCLFKLSETLEKYL